MAARTVVGLEITEESVRAAEVTTGPSPTLVAFGEVPLPDGAAKDSEIVDRDAVAVALQRLWAQSGIKSRNVVLGVGSRRILVREYATPLMSLELIRQALPFQVQDLLPVPVDQAVLDFYPVSEEGGNVHGLLIAAVSETIEDLVETVTKAKLHVERVDLAPFGLARVAKVVGQANEAVVMIHIGDHTTYVVVAVDGVPRFVRIIPAEIATGATARRNTVEILEEEPVEVAVVTDRRGRASMRVQSGEAAAIAVTTEAAASVTDLAHRLRNTIDFYASRAGTDRVTGVFVSGAGAANPAVLPALQSALDYPVRAVDLAAVLGTKAAIDGEVAFSLVGTIGIVLGEDK
ncbi:hypothetical protein ASD65_00320 [Microbacterium sp. Root61]|uniref:type IV pilus biogenesis protein PilM n=1 Tax=Microbacterium sp. Root61 TaxID=1736570 RepID=UPI0006F6E354|nr:pilus assembly protein PilM [Microbacterium sp. Root61]KRA23034.1 hypothetical protein ASD65_00320 [Microbacterium sp. Root61]